MTYLTWHLSKDLPLQRKLQTELLSLQPTLRVADGNEGAIPDPKALDALPTLHAVLMETLRLHAALPGPLPRQTPYPYCQIGPYRLPGGVRIAALAHTLHRNENVFPEPERFDPTRWLGHDIDEETRKERNRHFSAFSSGGRMCIGSNFAMQREQLEVEGNSRY
jgi:cytochrome P450